MAQTTTATKSTTATSQQKKTDGLSGFISAIGTNVGISLSNPTKKKDKFNPYSAENQSQVLELYTVMKSYKTKTSSQDIIVPNAVETTKTKTVKFEFEKELKADVFDDIVEKNGLKNISLDQSSKVIEINK